MKKKIVNVVLSVAVVTSMMFGVTACGSKDTTTAPAEDAAVTNSVADATEPAADESTVADAEDESTVADAEDAADDSTDADAEDAADDSTDADAADDSTDADAEDADAGEVSGSVEEWVNSEEAATYVTLFDTMFGGQMTTAFEADGDALVLAVILSDDIVGLDGGSLSQDEMAEMQAAMQQQYDSTADQFEPIRDELRNEVGDDSLSVQISYRLSDGTELFNQEL